MPKSSPLHVFAKALKRHHHFLLTCHVLPEGDAIGSILAIEQLLKKLGKKTTLVCDDDFPSRLHVLSSRQWNRFSDFKKPKKDFDAIVTTDCPTLERIGRVRQLIGSGTEIFNIDHHISNEYFGHYNYVRPEASACGEVVFEIFRGMKIPVTAPVAKNLYVAIMTDTGSFKYGNTTADCHRIVADLLATGIDVEKINDAVHSTYSLSKIQLYSKLLSRFKTAAGGRIAWTEMRRHDLEDSGATDEDAEGFIDFLKYLKEVRIAFFMMEMPEDRTIRVSFRSKGRYDVNRVATQFNGGGHKKASGCVIRGTLDEAQGRILKALQHVVK